MNQEHVIVVSPCFIIALAHPNPDQLGGHRLNVYRSPKVEPRSKIFNPVSEYIREHGLVLAMSETFEDDGWMFGSVIAELYTLPDDRAEWLTLEFHADMFEPCEVCDHFHDIETVHHMTEPDKCEECTGFHRQP